MMASCLINLILSLKPVLSLSCRRARCVAVEPRARVPPATWMSAGQALRGTQSSAASPPSSLVRSFYFVSSSWSFISQQACVCHPPALAHFLFLLPTFCAHFTALGSRRFSHLPVTHQLPLQSYASDWCSQNSSSLF